MNLLKNKMSCFNFNFCGPTTSSPLTKSNLDWSGNGLNILSICSYNKCEAFNRMIWINLGFGQGKFSVKSLYNEKCPLCSKKIKNQIFELGIKNAKIVFEDKGIYSEPVTHQQLNTFLPIITKMHTFQIQNQWKCISNIHVKNLSDKSLIRGSQTHIAEIFPSNNESSVSRIFEMYQKFTCQLTNKPIKNNPVYYICSECSNQESMNYCYEEEQLRKHIREGGDCLDCRKIMIQNNIYQQNSTVQEWLKFNEEVKMIFTGRRRVHLDIRVTS